MNWLKGCILTLSVPVDGVTQKWHRCADTNLLAALQRNVYGSISGALEASDYRWSHDKHYMKTMANWKTTKAGIETGVRTSKLMAVISQLLTTMNDEPESKDGICQSDTDSKPTCGRPDEPLTSLKLTIIGDAPLASVASTTHTNWCNSENLHHYSSSRAKEGVANEIAEAVVGALRGELAATSVNAPMVPAELAFPIAVLEHKYIKLICTGYLDSATEEAMEEFRRFEEEM
ncbi:hypothetical protein Tco_1540007 [Tanacetum coccineum]